MKKLGIIGGLGPMATAHYLALITQMSEALKDQDHIEILLHSCPKIPDRTDFITGKSALNPEPDLVMLGKELANAGAEIITVPCFTAHYFLQAIRSAIDIPVIDAIDETALYLKNAGIGHAGIIATDGMLCSGLYQDKLKAAGIKTYLPNPEAQRKIMELIYKIKSGQVIDHDCFIQISQPLFNSGAEIVLLGCSDLSLLKNNQNLGNGYLDVLSVLSRRAVLECGKLRPEYLDLTINKRGKRY